MNVLPQKQKEVLQTLLALLQQSETERGCLSYGIFSDIEEEDIFNLISEWENRQYLDQHMRSDRYSILLGTKSLLSEPLRVQILASSDWEGMEMVHDLRKKRVLPTVTGEITTLSV
jgi:quinol monooxygenase YgiN